jgi:hypothetical protein
MQPWYGQTRNISIWMGHVPADGVRCKRAGRERMQHMTEEVTVPMFEPDAESMPAEQLAEVQQCRLRGLIDRLLASAAAPTSRWRTWPGSR